MISCNTFFISDNNELYGCGRNSFAKEYGKFDMSTIIYTPIPIPEVKDVIDAQSNLDCAVALCHASNDKDTLFILVCWIRKLAVDLPQELIELCISFTRSTIVYSTRHEASSGHPEDEEIENGWNEIEIFKKKKVNIVKIAIGGRYSLFLDEQGNVWACGDQRVLGFGDQKFMYIFVPKEIPYFVKNDIKIKDIEAGFDHSLAVDINNNVYSWGCNDIGQCGHDDDEFTHIYEPKQIEDVFDDYEIAKMGCGIYHSFVVTECGKYHLFGTNDNNACLTFDDKRNVSIPHRFDLILKQKFPEIEEIIDVSVGSDNTKIVCLARQ